jgi:hypothetical protein
VTVGTRRDKRAENRTAVEEGKRRILSDEELVLGDNE